MNPTLNPPLRVYELFAGKYTDQMLRLLGSGAQPLSVADVMRQRLNASAVKEKEVREALMQGWLSNYFDTVDGIAYNNDHVKIALRVPYLFGITPESPLKEGALIITPEMYGSLEGTEFTRKQLENAGINDRFSKSRVVAHPGWQALVAGDNHLLKEYANLIFSLVKEKYQEDTAMGFYITGEQGPSLRSWVLGGLGCGSVAVGGGHLDDGGGRLVGVRAVASEASAPESEERLIAYRSSVLAQLRNVQAATPDRIGAELKSLEAVIQGR